MAVVGLESTVYQVLEDEDVVELCAIIYSSSIECPVEYGFYIVVSIRDNNTGSYIIYIVTGN